MIKIQPKKQSGFSLLEVLITMIIVAIGLLGFAGLQTYSLKSNRVSMQRSMATLYAYSILDSMRANAANRNNYVQAFTATPDSCDPTGIAGSGDMATDDMDYWNQAISCNLPQGQGRIAVNGTAVTISIRWKDGTTPDAPYTSWSTNTSL
jgi:type IV pilus assembly protein PilV